MKLGIPRALGYYNYYAFWHGFFGHLGIDVVLSSPTNKETISKGAALVISDTCLPVKVYLGHVLNLLDKGIENIYVPSIQSIDYKVYNCSKLRGLPDLVRNVVNREFNLIEPTLDMSDKNQGFYQYLAESVEPFGITDKKLIKEASKIGWEMQNSFNMMAKSGVSFDKALKNAINGKVVLCSEKEEKPITVALIAHFYNIYDEQISMRVIEKLEEKLGARVFTSLNLSDEQMKEGLNLLDTNLYWANELEVSGAAGHYLNSSNVDGVITINAFGCGPDSIMVERIARSAKDISKPLLTLTIDEHTGEAGFITRLEAFCDMLLRQKRIKLSKQLETQVDFEQPQRKEEEKIKILSA